MKVKNAKNIKNVNTNAKSTKTANKTKRVSAAIVDGVKTALKKAVSKTAAFVKATQAYRVWKRLDESSYKMQGHGTIANLRTVELKKVDSRGVGQEWILHRGELGYGFTWGKLIDKDTIHAGFMQIRFDKTSIVATGKSIAELVRYTQKNGELNIGGIAKFKALSNGGRYAIYTDGKGIARFEGSGRASGSYQSWQVDGAQYGKFVKK